MIIRVTQRLAKKIKVAPHASLPSHVNPLLDWTAHLFMVSRWQFVMMTNSVCLYSVVLPGKGVSNDKAFVNRSMKALHDNLTLDGIANIFDTMTAGDLNSVSFCKAGDRRVLGSMNDLIFQAKCYFLEMGLSIEPTNMRLNDTPLSMLKYHNPRKSLLALVDEQKTGT